MKIVSHLRFNPKFFPRPHSSLNLIAPFLVLLLSVFPFQAGRASPCCQGAGSGSYLSPSTRYLISASWTRTSTIGESADLRGGFATKPLFYSGRRIQSVHMPKVHLGMRFWEKSQVGLNLGYRSEVGLQYGYDWLPQYVYNPWIPESLLLIGVLMPTGQPPYGRGEWQFALGVPFIWNSVGSWVLQPKVSVSQSYQQWSLQISNRIEVIENRLAARIQCEPTFGELSGRELRYFPVTLALMGSVQKAQVSASYTDTSLIGPARGHHFERSIALGLGYDIPY